ncbi:MAG: hypothetical protein A2660_03130 [Candidatus Doudnabacteria bacterium RIFCSPHIGHO2_01_FULL_45_18]|uniref:Type II toxin-antitoxin system HicA family toxin n=1 Tax=Candidatus Doudnabacteria bacterium RIFCSPHIGHO2_01_FULL_45_18 TaxID=1817823 RepID=A0A1F5NSW1_9BACT|nr:MAG: hypothetical protein A2660_03130 [Candidatus Doudnabacteria bacterium RIFCSPHIGHO2_01_FULL_45_18]
MPKLKTLSGTDVIKILSSLGFNVTNQKGSHVKLSRISNNGLREILTVPNHKELDKGTLKAIFRQASRYIPENELYKHFYG